MAQKTVMATSHTLEVGPSRPRKGSSAHQDSAEGINEMFSNVLALALVLAVAGGQAPPAQRAERTGIRGGAAASSASLGTQGGRDEDQDEQQLWHA